MTIFEARQRRLAHDTYRFTCGRRGIDGWCRGSLGNATLSKITQPDGSIRAEWVLFHDLGIYQLPGKSGYRISEPARDATTGAALGRRDGRRPRPGRLQVASGTQRLVGQTPTLPAPVWCPLCHRLNHLDNPTPMP